MLDWTDTIVAPATARGAGARGILRLSGPEAPRLVQQLCVEDDASPLPSQKSPVPSTSPVQQVGQRLQATGESENKSSMDASATGSASAASRQEAPGDRPELNQNFSPLASGLSPLASRRVPLASPARLSDTAWQGPAVFPVLIEIPSWHRRVEAIIYTWPTGRSATNQSIVEIHLPASGVLIDAVEEALIKLGARRAQPGEFTLRSFLAGKLDLVQAEGVLGLIEAKSTASLTEAIDRKTGGLSRRIIKTRDSLVNLLADIEAGLDFIEEDISFVTDDEIANQLSQASRQLAEFAGVLHKRGSDQERLQVVLIGPPNAGKSSLFNALLGRDRALTSDQEGTTRDVVSATLELAGKEVDLVDTAGWGSIDDPLLQLAQEQRERAADIAALLLECRSVEDGAAAWSVEKASLRIRTKGDLMPNFQDESASHIISIHDPASIEPLLAAIAERLMSITATSGSSAARVSEGLALAQRGLEETQMRHRDSAGHEIVAQELRGVTDTLGELVGAVYSEELLDRIFSRFCIGK